MIRRPPRSTLDRSSAASDVYKRQVHGNLMTCTKAAGKKFTFGFVFSSKASVSEEELDRRGDPVVHWISPSVFKEKNSLPIPKEPQYSARATQSANFRFKSVQNSADKEGDYFAESDGAKRACGSFIKLTNVKPDMNRPEGAPVEYIEPPRNDIDSSCSIGKSVKDQRNKSRRDLRAEESLAGRTKDIKKLKASSKRESLAERTVQEKIQVGSKRFKADKIKEPTANMKTPIKKYASIKKQNPGSVASSNSGSRKGYTGINWPLKFSRIKSQYKKAQTSHLPQSSNNESKKKTKHKRCRKQEARDRKKRRNIDLMYILDNDPYNVLELKPGESQESVKRSYKEKVLKAHPDKGGSVEDFLRLKTAYEILSDER
eukprot:TRINITY_DN615_c0_g2_i25.p1 TRINITY_DN615_c0_g2~~TRINITY_DN615_c0_g2_i25.p1  ORF type:complete len:405 (-),score=77.22 TRINITY_DN615_c0_g2_i25:245-1363(-)